MPPISTGAIIMGLLSASTAIGGSIMAGEAAADAAQTQAAIGSWAELEKQLGIQKKNRETARRNALNAFNNTVIEESSNKKEAGDSFWLHYNFGNATGAFSRRSLQVNDQLMSSSYGRNLRGQTAGQLLNDAFQKAREPMINQRVAYGVGLRSIQRAHDQALSKRNFGYNESITYMPQPDQEVDRGGIMSMALARGIVTGAMSGVSTYYSTAEDIREYKDYRSANS